MFWGNVNTPCLVIDRMLRDKTDDIQMSDYSGHRGSQVDALCGG